MRMSVWAAIALISLALTGCSAGGAVPSAAVPSEAAPPAASVSAEPSAAPATTAPSASSAGGGRGDYDYGTGGEASPSASAATTGTVQVGTTSGALGTWLTGPGGLTLYTFEPDSANTSTCVDDCAQAWPPFTITADDSLAAGDGVTGELTTFERPDGTLQVAYDGAPLYYFTSDTGPGDTNGQGLGDRWFVAEP